jgi:outer membrane lipoprotein-sorting protein
MHRKLSKQHALLRYQPKEGEAMKNAMIVLLVSVVIAAQTAAQQPMVSQQKDASLPTADQIIEKYIQALGGKAAIEKISSRVVKGTFELPAMGVSGTATIYAKAPNKMLAVFDIPGFGTVREGYNGTVAWEQNPDMGLREKSGAELAFIKLESEFYKDIKLKELYPKINVKGKEKVGDRDVYLVEATPSEGSPEKWYFDVQTGLIIRRDFVADTAQGSIPMEQYFEDYKEVDGMKLPFTLRQTSPAISFIVKVTEVKNNAEIEDAKFNKPAAQ